MAKKIVKTFVELKNITLSEVIEKEYWLEFKHHGDFSTSNLHEEIMELVKHYSLCSKWEQYRPTYSFRLKDAEHFGTEITPFIKQLCLNNMGNPTGRWGYMRNPNLFNTVSFYLSNCEIDKINIYRTKSDYYIIADDLKMCSVFFYNENGVTNGKEYPIYRLLRAANKRRLGEIKKEKNEKIRKFEMELVIMGLQGFLEIPSLSLEKTTHSNMAKTAFLRANGFTITANYKRDWDANLYDLTNYNNSINMKQLNHKDLKIILTALKEIGKL